MPKRCWTPGDLEPAKRAFEALRSEPAAVPAAELGLGRIAAAEGHHDAAVAHFERAVALFDQWGAAYYALALSYRALGRSDDALRALERHAQYGARWPAIDDPVLATVTALRDDAGTNLQNGLKLADAGDLAGAVAAHEAALVQDPTIAQAHVNLISLYGRTRQWEKAEQHYVAAIALGFNLDEAHYNYGVLLGLQERWELAAEAYRKAIAVNPRHAGAYNNLGQILERERQIEAAATAYRQAVDAQPTFRLARFNLGRMLIALARPDEAVLELEKLTEPRDAEAPRYLFALATAHVRAGHRDEGVKWATDAKALALAHGQARARGGDRARSGATLDEIEISRTQRREIAKKIFFADPARVVGWRFPFFDRDHRGRARAERDCRRRCAAALGRRAALRRVGRGRGPRVHARQRGEPASTTCPR